MRLTNHSFSLMSFLVQTARKGSAGSYPRPVSSLGAAAAARVSSRGCFSRRSALEHYRWRAAWPISFTFAVSFITSEFIRFDIAFG